jgi:hypothetical protein
MDKYKEIMNDWNNDNSYMHRFDLRKLNDAEVTEQ